jgi:hypothetical protein
VKCVRSFADGLLRADTNVSLNGGGRKDHGAHDAHYGGPVFIDRRITTKGAMGNGYRKVRSFFHARPKSHGYSQ